MQKIVAKKTAWVGGERTVELLLVGKHIPMLSADFIGHPPPPPLPQPFRNGPQVSSCHFPIKECVYTLKNASSIHTDRLKIVNKLFSHVLMHAFIMTLDCVPN